MLAGMLVLAPGVARAAPPQFVQTRAKEIRSGTTNALAFNSANTAGNLVVVYVVWSNTNAVTVSDSRGNAYAAALGRTTWGSGWSAQVFYARNVAGGANTVTATFATSIASFADALSPRVLERGQGQSAGRVPGRHRDGQRDEQRCGDDDQRATTSCSAPARPGTR